MYGVILLSESWDTFLSLSKDAGVCETSTSVLILIAIGRIEYAASLWARVPRPPLVILILLEWSIELLLPRTMIMANIIPYHPRVLVSLCQRLKDEVHTIIGLFCRQERDVV